MAEERCGLIVVLALPVDAKSCMWCRLEICTSARRTSDDLWNWGPGCFSSWMRFVSVNVLRMPVRLNRGVVVAAAALARTSRYDWKNPDRK